jgi:membrane-associated protein
MDLMQIVDLVMKVDLKALLDLYGIYVYVVLFAIIFSETGLVVLFFFPGDTLLFIAGAFCSSGDMNIFLLNALLITAAVTGNTLNYWIGSRLGQRVYTHDYRWINKDALRRTHDFFEKHGGKTIILARFVPVVRTFAPFVAGVSKMDHWRFQMFNITGATLWVVSLTVAGFFFGKVPIIRDNLTTIVMIGVAAAVVPVALGAMYKFGRKLLAR